MQKTIYISGPITDLTTGQPREGWQQDFLDAEAKLRRMGFNVINPVDIAREVEGANKERWEYIPRRSTPDGDPLPPTRADYIMECLEYMKNEYDYDRLHGVYVIGDDIDCQSSHGVRMEVLMAEVLGVPIYSEDYNDLIVDDTLIPIDSRRTIKELLND